MSISYSFTGNVILLAFAGKYGVDEMQTTITAALADSACPDKAVMLLDMRGDESVQQRSPEDIRQMSYFFAEIRDRINRRLCMVTSDSLAFGLMNMARAYDQSVGIECQVFTDIDQALAWLASEAPGF